jgi:hypothetical protein
MTAEMCGGSGVGLLTGRPELTLTEARLIVSVHELVELCRREGPVSLEVYASIAQSDSDEPASWERHFMRTQAKLRRAGFRVDSKGKHDGPRGLLVDFSVDEALHTAVARSVGEAAIFLETREEPVAEARGEDLVDPIEVAAGLGLSWESLTPKARAGVEALATLRLADGYLRDGLAERARVAADQVEDDEVRARLNAALGKRAEAESDEAEAPADWWEETRLLAGAIKAGLGEARALEEQLDPEALTPKVARAQLETVLAEARARRKAMHDEVEVAVEAAPNVNEEANVESKARATTPEQKTCDECGERVYARGFSSHQRRHERERAKVEAPRSKPRAPVRVVEERSADPLTALREALAALPEGARRPALELMLALDAS